MLDELEVKIRGIVKEYLGVTDDEIKPDATWAELRADSLDRVELTIALEEEFDIEIYDGTSNEWENYGQMVEGIRKLRAESAG